jgi:rRNA maturation protein Nop10
VKRFGKYRRKVSWIVKRYGNYGRKVGWIIYFPVLFPQTFSNSMFELQRYLLSRFPYFPNLSLFNLLFFCILNVGVWKSAGKSTGKMKCFIKSYTRKVDWIVKRFGKYRRFHNFHIFSLFSSIFFISFHISSIFSIIFHNFLLYFPYHFTVERFGKYRRKLWNEMENTEEK